MEINDQAAVYVISVAAELSGMHPQTLRQYDRLGLVTPQRTAGRGRRYSADDIRRLRLIQQLSQNEGINLAGIRRILDLNEELDRMNRRAEALHQELRRYRSRSNEASRVFAAASSGDVVSLWGQGRPRPRIAGALGAGSSVTSVAAKRTAGH